MTIIIELEGNIDGFFYLQILSRTKAVEDPRKKSTTSAQDKNKKKEAEIEDFIAQRDYTGAIAFLEVFIY